MTEIKELITNICDEIEDAEKYVDLALQYKDFDRSLADTYLTLSNQELGHADMLHGQSVRLIREYVGNDSEVVKIVWDYEHQKFVEQKAKVRTKIDMCR